MLGLPTFLQGRQLLRAFVKRAFYSSFSAAIFQAINTDAPFRETGSETPFNGYVSSSTLGASDKYLLPRKN
jgi:hypothetical protein